MAMFIASGPPSGSLRYVASRPPHYRPVPPRLDGLPDQFVDIPPFSGAPQPFKVVELPCPGGEYMDNEIDVVYQDLFGFIVIFDVEWMNILFFELFFNVVCNSLVVLV